MKSILTSVLFVLCCLISERTFGQASVYLQTGSNPSCGNAAGYLGASCSGCSIVVWQEGTFNAQTQQFTVQNSYSGGQSSFVYNVVAPGEKSYRVGYVMSGSSVVSYTNPLTVQAFKPVGGTLSTATTSFLNSGSGQLVLTGASGTLQWLRNGTNVTLTNGNFSITETSTFVARLTEGPCSATSNDVTVRIYKVGTLSGPASVTEGGKVTFSWVGRDADVIRWEYSTNGGSSWTHFDYSSYGQLTGDKFADTHEIWTNTKFRVFVSLGPFGTAYTNTVDVAFIPYTQTNADPTNGGNYVREQEVTVAGITNPTSVSGLPNTQKRQVTTYLDGTGKPVQQNLWQVSPNNQRDIISVDVYDRQGRTPTEYLPYVSSLNNGAYKTSPLTEQQSYYNNGTADKVTDSSHPYAKTIFEKSPLGRITEQGGVGPQWQPGSGHSNLTSYSNNMANEAWLFKSIGAAASYYGVNELTKFESTDPDQKKTQTFIDKAGRTILTRTQLDETINGTLVPWLETYYIYNELGNIRFILPPKGVAALKSATWVLSQAIVDQHAHQFVYDSRGRLIEKKVPGQAWIYYCYDRLDRLILVQDGFLRGQNKWTYIKYDRRGRPVMQGLYTNTTHTTRAAIQTNVVDPLFAVDANKHYEERGTAAHGYTNQVFPTSGTEVLTVNYYDTYDFDNNGTDDYGYVTQSLANENTPATTVFGLPTGSKRIVLGTSTWLYNYIFYDKKGRLIQSRSNNHLSTAIDNLVTVVYDFEGKATIKKTYHNAGAGKITTVIIKYAYDHMGRLTNVYQNNNSASADQLIARYEYNELGQLVDKKLHNTSGSNFLQSVDFRYSIQGWLTSINNSQLNSDGVKNDETNDYFGMEFIYEAAESGLSNGNYFNGNISAVKWKGIGSGAGAADQTSYKFTYDKANRLKTSVSQMHTGSAWTKEVNGLNESTTYDVNGNILSLQRNQRKHQLVGLVASYTNETIDNLTYTYSATILDQLTKVEDTSGNTSGFKNGSTASVEYTYDSNGNLLSDLNKGVSSVVYNFLGKPTQINFSDGRKIDYIYDASGSKLSMKTYQGTAVLSTTDYVDGFVYDGGVLDFFSSPEGRVANAEAGVNRIANASCSTTTGFAPNQNVSVSAVVVGSQDYVKAVCNQSTSTPGVYPFEGNLSVVAGENYVFRVRGYASTANCYLYVNTNLGDLIWPGVPLPTGAANEKWVQVKFVVPPGATLVRIGVLWSGPAAGQEVYLNHVELRKLNLEYQYAIADHQNNTRVVFSSVNPSETKIATFEGNAGDNSKEFQNVVATNVVTFVGANNTPSGTKVVRMNQTYKLGPSKSLKVFPGDKVDLEVYAYHENSSGYGTSSTPLTTVISMVAGGFGGVSGGVGESGFIYSGVNQALTAFGYGANRGDTRPAAYLNYILFDKNFKVLNAGAQSAPDAPMTKTRLFFNTINIKEPGYLFVYLTYDNASNNWVYFDDLKVAHTKTNVIQYNEYYPFGLQASTSWTRENTKNDFLYNASSELNTTSGWYETHFRNYDPALGRFIAIDPLATRYVSHSAYHYAFNNPTLFNDPTGAYPDGYGSGPPPPPEFMFGTQGSLGASTFGTTLGNLSNWGNFGNSYLQHLSGRVWNPWGGEYNEKTGTYNGEWMRLNSYEAQVFLENKADDPRVRIEYDQMQITYAGIGITNTEQLSGFIRDGMWVINTSVGALSTSTVYTGKYYKWNDAWHYFKNKPNAYFWQNRFKQLKGIRTIQANKVAGARNLSGKLTKIGGVLIAADIVLSGELKPSHAINAAMLAASTTGVGAIAAGIWFIADFGTMGVNYLLNGEAKGIGDMIDESVGTIELYEGVY
jgi:RHS repeat-associated protein